MYIYKNYDVVVVGGGLSGVCAAIASARHGAKTALIQDRPVLGGNASSEIRMHICGANIHGSRENARETGILEEILLENRKNNPQHSFSILDTVLWEKVNFQENLDLYLNTRMIEVKSEKEIIVEIMTHQLTTEKEFVFRSTLFIDCTGDGILAYKAGADYRIGRESKSEFNEQYAPDKADRYTMGSSVMFKSVNMGYPVSFVKPYWAYDFTEEDLKYRGHSQSTSPMQHYGVDSGYWWIELGGDQDTISDAEEIRDELLKTIYGVWDHIKNSGDHGADHYALDWVQFLPGKRESRRIEGDYILKEQDLLLGKIFKDAVAYGGWPMDMHPPQGFKYKGEPTDYIDVPDLYTIPYRCYYSKNIKNLMMAGRNISTSHMAFGSTRVMATCAIGGQAVGTAAAMAIRYECLPKKINNHMKELQQILLKDDCYLPSYKNKDQNDYILTAKIRASSYKADGLPENVANGVARNTKENNSWWSDKIGPTGEWIELELEDKKAIKQVHIKFDSSLSEEIVTSLSEATLSRQNPGIPATLVKDYEIQIFNADEMVYQKRIKDNYLRYQKHDFTNKIIGNKIKIIVYSTYGIEDARIFEVRAYG